MEKLCCTCVWWSSGVNDPNGAGYCYSESDFTDADSRCDFWQKSLRDTPVLGPDEQLAANVAANDNQVDD